MENPTCPKCGSKTSWDLQDSYVAIEDEGIVFSERMLVCDMHCGWHGCSAWFPWEGAIDRFELFSINRCPKMTGSQGA